VLHVLLDIRVIESTSNETLGVEHGVTRVHGRLVFGGYCQRIIKTNPPSPMRRSPSVKAT
jgi:hypothetical protein